MFLTFSHLSAISAMQPTPLYGTVSYRPNDHWHSLFAHALTNAALSPPLLLAAGLQRNCPEVTITIDVIAIVDV